MRAAIVLLLLAVPAHAYAQSDASGYGVHGPPSSQAILFQPLTLGLAGEVPPLTATEPGCRDHLEATGNATASSAGTPMQFSFARVLAPRLTLFGMSRAGCAVDASLGAGLVYVVPLRPKVFFVAGFGALLQPPFGSRPAIVHVQGRADVVFDRGQGRSWNVGLRTSGGTSGVSFGGIF